MPAPAPRGAGLALARPLAVYCLESSSPAIAQRHLSTARSLLSRAYALTYAFLDGQSRPSCGSLLFVAFLASTLLTTAVDPLDLWRRRRPWRSGRVLGGPPLKGRHRQVAAFTRRGRPHSSQARCRASRWARWGAARAGRTWRGEAMRAPRNADGGVLSVRRCPPPRPLYRGGWSARQAGAGWAWTCRSWQKRGGSSGRQRATRSYFARCDAT